MRISSPASSIALVPVFLAAACGEHRPIHVAPDESRPHVSWEIRAGGASGEDEAICGSKEPARPCVLTAATQQQPSSTTVHLFLHAASEEASYVGQMRVAFIEGRETGIGRPVAVTVPAKSQPVSATVTGRVVAKPGAYTFSFVLDATLAGASTPQLIAQEIAVTVR